MTNARENTARLLRPDLFDRADLVVQTFASYPMWLRFAYVMEAVGNAVQAAYAWADEVIAVANADLMALQSPSPAGAEPAGEEDSFWLVLREPGTLPERKGPWKGAGQQMARTLREFIAARPTAYIDVLTWSPGYGPLVRHGPDVLQMLDGRSMSVGRRHNARTRAAHADHHVAPCPLAWLAENESCELSFDYGDADDDGKGWCVHRVNGGRNDREWTLIGSGLTPAAAVIAAQNFQRGVLTHDQ
jgi:hypothetical protein